MQRRKGRRLWKRKKRMRETAPVAEVKKQPARQQEKSHEMCDPLTVTTQFVSKGHQLSNVL